MAGGNEIRRESKIKMRTLDWEVMKKGASEVVSKGFVIYGASSTGKRFADYLSQMGIMGQVQAVFDSDEKKWGEEIQFGHEINPPERLEEIPDDIPVVITSVFVKEIVEYLDKLGYENKCVLTAKCLKLAIHYDIMNNGANGYLEEEVRSRYQLKYNIWRKCMDNRYTEMAVQKKMRGIITGYPTSILIHSIPKTGNMTLAKSLAGMSNAIMTCHHVYYGKEMLQEFHELLSAFSERQIRIISGIREPIEGKISGMWQNIHLPFIHNDKVLGTVITDDFALEYEEWLEDEIHVAFGIDVFAEPFDKKKGYTIIRRDNVSLFLYRIDFLSSLEQEIGDFVGMKNFKLLQSNLAEAKAYNMAYHSFLNEVRIGQENMKKMIDSKYMKHFYTENERIAYQKKWDRQTV